MSQAEKLLNSLGEDEVAVYTLTPEEEPHIIVNSDRSVTVPDQLKDIAVQFDHNIETVTFDNPRYWDGHDLSTMHVYVNYKRPDGYMDSYPVDNLRVDETDDSVIHFEWTISGNVTEVKGNITFLVCAKSASEEGVLERHWNSKPNSDLTVLEGMDYVEGVVESNLDVIEQQLLKIEVLEQKIENAASSWNDLTDKPFYEEEVEVDKIINEASFTVPSSMTSYSVSNFNSLSEDAGLLMNEDVDYYLDINGITLKSVSGNYSTLSSAKTYSIYFSDDADNGIYVYWSRYSNGELSYNNFNKEYLGQEVSVRFYAKVKETAIKSLSEKLISEKIEHLIKWDGDTEGLTTVEGTGNYNYYKISDETVPVDYIVGSLWRTRLDRDTYVLTQTNVDKWYDGGSYGDYTALYVYEAGHERFNCIFPEIGTYVEQSTLTYFMGYYEDYKLSEEIIPSHSHKWSDIEDPPFGVGDVVEKLILDETLTEWVDVPAGYSQTFNVDLGLVEGQAYRIELPDVDLKGDVTCEINSYSGNNVVCYSNCAYVTDNSDGTCKVSLYSDRGAGSQIKVYAYEQEIKTLDEKVIPNSVKAKSDWNQNDTTAADYIKNRPFYKETRETLETLGTYTPSETTIYRSVGQYEWPSNDIIVSVDGQDYTLTYSGLCYKNDELGMSFSFNATMDGATSTVPESMVGKTLTFSAIEKTTVYHTINSKYIPSTYVTETSLSDKGYVTETSLSDKGYVTETSLSDKGYVTETSLSDKGYVTETSLIAGQKYIQSNITSGQFSAVYYANGVWVAGSASGLSDMLDADRGLYYSTDGMTWTQSNITSGGVKSIHYANGVWNVVCTTTKGLYYSTDGITWNQRYIDGINTRISTVYHANNMWVVGTYSTSNTVKGTGLYYSTDGITWTQSNITSGYFEAVYYANGVWVAGSCNKDSLADNDVGLYYSTDGITWTQSNITSGSLIMIHYANGMWVAGSYISSSNNTGATGLYYSTDGITWTQSNITSRYFKAVYYANGVWVINSTDYNSTDNDVGLYYSTDGITWTQSNITSRYFKAVYYANGVWVINSTDNDVGLYYSTDGITWTQSNITSGYFEAVYYANGVWVFGNSGSVYGAATGTGLYYGKPILSDDHINNLIDAKLGVIENGSY